MAEPSSYDLIAKDTSPIQTHPLDETTTNGTSTKLVLKSNVTVKTENGQTVLEVEDTKPKKQPAQPKYDKDGKKVKSCLYRIPSIINTILTCVLANPVIILLTMIGLFGLCLVAQYCDWTYLNNEWYKSSYQGMAYTLQMINIISITICSYPWLGKIMKIYLAFFLMVFGKVLQWAEEKAYARECTTYIKTIKFKDGSIEEEIYNKNGVLYRIIAVLFCIAWGTLFIYCSLFAVFVFVLVAQIFRFPALIFMYFRNRHDSGFTYLVTMIITWMCLTQLLESAGMTYIMYWNNEELGIWNDSQRGSMFNGTIYLPGDVFKIENEFGFMIASILAGVLLLIVPLQIYLYSKVMEKKNIQRLVSQILNQKKKSFQFYLGCTKDQAVNYSKGNSIPCQIDGNQGSGIYLHRKRILAEKNIRDQKNKTNEAVVELLVDLGKVLMIEQKDHSELKEWGKDFDSLFVPRGILDRLIETYVIKDSKSVVTVLNAKEFIKIDEKEDEKMKEKMKDLVPVKEMKIAETEQVHPFLEKRVKQARQNNLNKAYEIAILRYLHANAKKKESKQQEKK